MALGYSLHHILNRGFHKLLHPAFQNPGASDSLQDALFGFPAYSGAQIPTLLNFAIAHSQTPYSKRLLACQQHLCVSELWHRIRRAQVLHEQGRRLLVQSRLPLHKGLVQELDSITAQLGLLLPVHQPAVTESSCAHHGVSKHCLALHHCCPPKHILSPCRPAVL